MIGNITAEDHDGRYYVTNMTVMQQQLKDLEFAGKLIIMERQDHRMIDIEELINDWLGEAV